MENFMPIIEKVIEYAPAVAILLWLNWRMERQLSKLLEICFQALIEDEND